METAGPPTLGLGALVPDSGKERAESRLAPLATALGLAGAAAYVALRDPARQSGFVPCPFHRVTGLWCPACGLTRGVHALLTGHPLVAIGENVFTPLVVLGVIVAWVAWSRRRWFGARWRLTLGHRGQTLLAAALVVYGVLRNIPAAPLRSLAP